ncbi:MAG TPA: hypothetical protein VHE13_15810 [Opitutus sp.]|nr:hypothetical protein [Opitutus sp.]
MNAHPASPPASDALRGTVLWLAAHARFPASRLEAKAETMLCMAALAAVAETAANPRFLIESRDIAKDAAQRAHAQRRSHAHFKSDNSAKV